jgi:putative oxidoreductase
MIIYTPISSRSAGLWLLGARILIASLFVFAGLEKIFKYQDAVAFAAGGGIPFAAYLLPFSILLELGAVVGLFTRRYCRLSAFVLAIWTFILNFMFHKFWSEPPATWQLIVDSFFHALVMTGGLIYVAVFGVDGAPADVSKSGG